MNVRLTLLAFIIFVGLLFRLPTPKTLSQNSNLNNYGGCPMKGQTNTACLQAINRLKNRWKSEPTDADINSAITLDAILASGDDETRWNVDDAAECEPFLTVMATNIMDSSRSRSDDISTWRLHRQKNIDLCQ